MPKGMNGVASVRYVRQFAFMEQGIFLNRYAPILAIAACLVTLMATASSADGPPPPSTAAKVRKAPRMQLSDILFATPVLAAETTLVHPRTPLVEH